MKETKRLERKQIKYRKAMEKNNQTKVSFKK